MGKFNLLTTLSVSSAGLDTGLSEAKNAVKDYAGKVKSENEKVNLSFRDVATMGFGEMRKEMRALRNISFAGKSIEEIDAINARIGELSDSMGDLRVQQNAYGAEFGTAMAGGLETVSAIGEVALGAATLFGASEEQAQKYERAMVQLIGVTQALGVIENAMQQKQLKTIAIKIRSLFVTKAETAATTQAAVAQRGLNAALLANPYVLAAAGISAVVVTLSLLAGSHKRTTPEIDKTAEAYQHLLDVQKELISQSEDLKKANEEAATKMLIDAGKMTQKEADIIAIQQEKKAALKAVDEQYMESLRSAQKSFETVRGYDYVQLEKDKTKALEDANTARAEILKKAFLSEKALNAESKKATKGTASAYDALNTKIAEYNRKIADGILLNQNVNALINQRNALESQKQGVDLVLNQMQTRDSGGLLQLPSDVTEEVQAQLDDFVSSIVIEPIPLEVKPVGIEEALMTVQEKSALIAQAINGISDAFVAMASGQEASIKGVLQSTLGAVRQVIMAKLAESMAKMIAGESSKGLPGLALAGIGIIGIQALFAKLPKFESGGVIPGSLVAGDMVTARVNSGEMVLNKVQQARLFNIANGSESGGINGNVTFEIHGDKLVGVLNRHSRMINSGR